MSFFINFFNRIKNIVAHRYPRLFSRLLKHKSIVKFTMSGPVSGAIDLVVLYILHGLLYINVIWSTTFAYIISFGFSFYLQKFWTFNNLNRKRVYHQMVIYFFFAFINLNINGYLMHIAVNRYHIWYLLAQLLVGIITGLISYLAFKFIIFRKRCDD